MRRFPPPLLPCIATLILTLACAREAATPAPTSRDDVTRLRWIAGDWRGVGAHGTVQPAFYERYLLPDDTTLLVISFADSTWRTATDTTRYILTGGRFGNGGTGARWAATRIDSLAADFDPVEKARNSFRWERAPGSGVHPGEWRATIVATDSSGARRERRYLMQRVTGAP